MTTQQCVRANPTGCDNACVSVSVSVSVLLLVCLGSPKPCTGIFHKVPFTQQQWYEFALTPPDEGTLKFIFKLGQADAAAWAKHTGRATQQGSTPASSQQQPAGGRKLLTAAAAGRATTH